MKLVTFKILTTEQSIADEIYGELKIHLLKYARDKCGGTLPHILVEDSIKDVSLNEKLKGFNENE